MAPDAQRTAPAFAAVIPSTPRRKATACPRGEEGSVRPKEGEGVEREEVRVNESTTSPVPLVWGYPYRLAPLEGPP